MSSAKQIFFSSTRICAMAFLFVKILKSWMWTCICTMASLFVKMLKSPASICACAMACLLVKNLKSPACICACAMASLFVPIFFSPAGTWRFDVADLNPLRWPRAVVTSVQRNTLNTTERVWIGRNGGVGFTYHPGLDVAHWAVSINGDIYEIGVEGPGLSGSGTTRSAGKHSLGTGGTWKVFTEDRIERRRGEELQWTRLCGNPPVIRTREELLDFASGGEGLPYGLTDRNCQLFAAIMVKFACGYPNWVTAALAVRGTFGTILF